MDEQQQGPDYGTIAGRFGCLGDTIGCSCVCLMAVIAALSMAAARHSLLMAEIVVGVALIAWLADRLFLTNLVKADPEGLTFGTMFKQRRILWRDVKWAQKARKRDVPNTAIWVGGERIDLDSAVEENWPLSRLIWKYLRHYAECVGPKRRKRKGQAPEQDVEADKPAAKQAEPEPDMVPCELTTAALAYPVLVIDKLGFVSACADEDMLTTLNSVSFKKGGYTDSTIVDDTGRAIKVLETRFVAGKGRFWGYTPFLDRIIRVRLVLGRVCWQMPLEDLKEAVVDYMEQGAHEADYRYMTSEMRKIRNATTVSGVIGLSFKHFDVSGLWEQLRKL